MQIKLYHITTYNSTTLKETLRHIMDSSPEIRKVFCEAKQGPLIVVKPNWVQESHEFLPDLWEPVITHPAIVMAVVECLAEKMEGLGTICICDAPHTYASFDNIVARGNLKLSLNDVQQRWPDIHIELFDLRREVWIRKEEVVVSRHLNKNDPRGCVKLDMGRDSLFYRHKSEGRYYGADYDSKVVNDHHHGEIQEYLLAGTPMACDLFVNLPKLKTHKKTGITCALKNLVGINGDKNWLPHHSEGTPASGGDEFPDEAFTHLVEGRLKKFGRHLALAIPEIGPWLFQKMRNAGKCVLGDSEETIRNGNWQGNDTCWRMVIDLNRALLYGNADGSWRKKGQAKNYFTIVDGITGGEGNGPLCPVPVQSGVLLAGNNPAGVDAVACKLMGFDPAKIPLVKEAFADHRWPISSGKMDDIQIYDDRLKSMISLDQVAPAFPGGFKPHFGWPTLAQKE